MKQTYRSFKIKPDAVFNGLFTLNLVFSKKFFKFLKKIDYNMTKKTSLEANISGNETK